MCSNFPFFQIVFRNLRSAPPKVPVAFRARRYNKNLKNEKAGPFLLLLMTTICPNQFSTVPFFVCCSLPANCLLSISPQLLRNPSLLYCIAGELHNCDEVSTAQARFQSSSLFATTERGVGEIPGNDVAYINESSVMFVGTITVKRRLKIFRILS